jgi:hypothetical protein
MSHNVVAAMTRKVRRCSPDFMPARFVQLVIWHNHGVLVPEDEIEEALRELCPCTAADVWRWWCERKQKREEKRR